MTWIDWMLSRLRTLWTTVAATVVGVVNVATRRSESSIELKPGDAAPDFVLPGSDGRTYRLRDFIGRRAVVLAWFPKAFTGG
jgi:peroxiredoxin Q/BCP